MGECTTEDNGPADAGSGSPKHHAPRSAICLSGGGIRSAAFSIGVLQALDEAIEKDCAGKPKEFECLSTVSGGGFAGAWYAVRRLNGEELSTALGELREKGGYLKTASSAELPLAFLAKLLPFWLFAIPAVWSVLLLLAYSGGGLRMAGSLEGAYLFVPAALCGAVALIALQYPRGRTYLASALALVLASVVAHYVVESGLDALKGLALLATGLPAAALALAARSADQGVLSWVTRRLGLARLVRLAAWLGIAVLVTLAAWLLAVLEPAFVEFFQWTAGRVPDSLLARLGLTLTIALSCGLLPAKRLSLAEIYRERIRDGFLLYRKTRSEKALTVQDLHPEPFLVINAAASIDERSHREWDERKAAPFAWTPQGYIDLRCPEPPRKRFNKKPKKPEALVDLDVAVATSAAVAGPRMGSFTTRPLGILLSLFNVRLGQWFNLGDRDPFERRGSVLELVLADLWSELADLWRKWRGVWRKRGGGTAGDWIHLTDGGHFENLGLYEMVRRRCERIIVVDASCDPHYRFSDLANAARKIRIDLGIDIDIDGLGWSEGGGEAHGASRGRRQRVYGGTIRYPEWNDKGQKVKGSCEFGQLVYIKAGLVGDEPMDVAGYADLHPDFPHESTADQWFSESQFESYRRLGEYTIESALDHYDAAKQLFVSKGAGGAERPTRDDVALVAALREAGMIAGRPELRPTHGGAIVRLHDNRYLLVKSIAGDSWVLPKGHIERGETPFQCARRELQEEAGIRWPPDKEKPKPQVVYDSFDKGDEEVRCFYYVLREARAGEFASKSDLAGIIRTPRDEDREEVWVTFEEYATALKCHPATAKEDRDIACKLLEEATPGKTAKDTPRDELLAARTLIPGLLWVLRQAQAGPGPPGRT